MDCPICHKQVELVPKPDGSGRMQAFCNHGIGLPPRCVIEINAEPVAPAAKPTKKGIKHDPAYRTK
jgi:hypothetical protein